jgi:hypothetical protein
LNSATSRSAMMIHRARFRKLFNASLISARHKHNADTRLIFKQIGIYPDRCQPGNEFSAKNKRHNCAESAAVSLDPPWAPANLCRGCALGQPELPIFVPFRV